MTLHRLFVYGTLRSGEANNAMYLGGATLENASVRINGFRMYALAGYPFILPEPGSSVLAESWLVTDAQLAHIDLLELFLGEGNPENEYNRISVAIVPGNAGFIYVYADEENADRRYPVDDGNWPAYRQLHQFGFCS
jgi:gamma-glutamylcyclotransferase (GGCT)/AIG2-like uncharacterized protein YtfP